MELSPTRTTAPSRGRASAASGSATKKRRPKAKKLPLTMVNEVFAPGRTNYQPEESIVLSRCWIDISKDPVFAYKRQREPLRKHWNQINKQINLFAGKCDKCEREQASGESLADVRDKAIQSYMSLYGDFKHYQSWALLKEKQKFVGGMLPESTAAKKRASKLTFGDYTSSESGASPMDLNHPVFKDESSGTPMSTRRPPASRLPRARARRHPPPPRRRRRPRARPRARLRLRHMPTRSWWPPPTIGRCWTRTTP